MKKASKFIGLILVFALVSYKLADQPKLAESITYSQQEAIDNYNKLGGIIQVFKTMNALPSPAQANYYADSVLAPMQQSIFRKLNDTTKVKK